MTKFSLTRRQTLCTLAAACLANDAFASEPNLLATAMAGTAVPGMAAITIRNFHAEREIVAGIRRLGAPDPIQRGDRWHLGSDGKAMTATLIARLCSQGVLSWQTPLERLLPELAASMHPAYRDVTLPDLLSHRAGLPSEVSFEFLVSFVDDTAPFPQQRRRYAETTLAEPPEIEKRTTHLYSNSGYVIAGAIAERATGMDFEALMRAQIFEPLDMESPTYEPFGSVHEPIGHVEGRIADQRLDPNPRVIAPSDGMRLSMRDWSRFCLDQLKGAQGRGRLMHGDNYRFMQQAQGQTNYGLGWFVLTRAQGRRGPAIYHSGSNGNWMAIALMYPHIGDGVLVTANSAYGMDGNTVAEAVVQQVAGTLSEPAPS